MGNNCAFLFGVMLLYLLEADFIQGILNENKKKLAQSLCFRFCLIVCQ